jgi:hypothetical protein
MRTLRILVGLSALSWLVGCSGHGPETNERTATTSSALTAAFGRPRPIAFQGGTASAWAGSDADLLLADAITECSWYSDGTMSPDTFPAQEDSELNRIYGLMNNAVSACYKSANFPNGISPSGNIVQDWYTFRTSTACNYDPNIAAETPSTGGASVPLVQSPSLIDYNAVSSVIGVNVYACPARWQLIQNSVDAFMRPSMNACIAHKVREQVNTSAAGDALVLTGYDQRMLTDTGRRLAQEAVIQYARLYEVATFPLASNELPTTSGGVWVPSGYDPILGYLNCANPNAPAPAPNEFLDIVRMELNYAGQGTVPPGSGYSDTLDLSALARDFADSVETLSYFGGDYLTIAVRDREAHTPRGGTPKTPADDRWGPMSWQQRASAAIYGGNAMAYELNAFQGSQASSDAPWGFGSGSNGSGTIGWAPWLTAVPRLTSNSNGAWGYQWFQWPSQDESGYVVSSLAAPGAAMLWSTALRLDTGLLNVVKVSPNQQGPNGLSGDEVCYQIDTSQGAAYGWYDAVESALRSTTCGQWMNCSQLSPIQTDPTAGGAYSNYLLYQRYAVAPSDATAALAYLHDELGSMCQGHSAVGTNLFVNGNLGLVAGSNPLQIQIKRGSQLVSHDETRVAALYNRNAQFNLFSGRRATFWLNVDATTEGFSAEYQGGADSEEGGAGVNQALTAAKFAIVDAIEGIPTCGTAYNAGPIPNAGPASRVYCNPNAQSLVSNQYVNTSDVLAEIAAQVGDQSVALRPETTVSTTPAPGNYARVQAAGTPWGNGAAAYFNLDVLVPNNDTWWPSTQAGWSNVMVYGFPNEPWAADLARYPTATYFGQTIATLLANGNNWSTNSGFSLGSMSIPAGSKTLQHGSLGIWLPNLTTNGQQADYWTLIAVNYNSSPPTYRVLVDGFRYQYSSQFPTADVGYFHSSGGTLGDRFANASKLLARDRSRPALDAFGLAWDWVPPTNPDLYSDNGQVTAAQHYLAQAQSAAQTATDAATTAITNMINEAKDASLAAQERNKASQVQQNAVQSLCGTQDPSKCDKSFTPMTLASLLPSLGLPNVGAATNPPWRPGQLCYNMGPNWSVDGMAAYYNLDALNHAGPGSAFDIWCYLALTVGPQSFDVPTPVLAHLNDPITPAFSEYNGGTLQVAFQQYWNGIKDAQNKFTILTNILANLAQSNNVFAAQQQGAQDIYAQCENQRSSDFVSGIMKIIGDEVSMLESEGATTMNFVTDGNTVENSQFIDPCQAQLQSSNGITEAQAGLAYAQAEASATAAMQAVLTSYGNLRVLSSQTKSSLLQSTQAQAMATVEADLASAGNTMTSGVFRRYNQWDAWRAGALLDAARRSAVTAVKAIEAQYALKLSSITSPLPLVDSPSNWVDTAYGYDLSIAQTIGVDTFGAAGTQINANQLTDYLANVQRFIDSVPIAMPSALGSDSLVIELDGPLAQTPGSAPAPGAYRWLYFCPNTQSWLQMPVITPPSTNPTLTCNGTMPTMVRYTFNLDPVGNIDWATPRQLQHQFNHRWKQVAINLVGTGIRDCSRASNPQDCYVNPYLTGNVTHLGPGPVLDYDAQPYYLQIDPGTIESMKFLAAEEVLDPVSNGWSAPYVQQIARTELTERPLGGTYTLDITVTPDVHLERIQQVQILLNEAFWVRQ